MYPEVVFYVVTDHNVASYKTVTLNRKNRPRFYPNIGPPRMAVPCQIFGAGEERKGGRKCFLFSVTLA
jgi:hypothetical protein